MLPSVAKKVHSVALEALIHLLVEKKILYPGEFERLLHDLELEHWARGENLPPSED